MTEQKRIEYRDKLNYYIDNYKCTETVHLQLTQSLRILDSYPLGFLSKNEQIFIDDIKLLKSIPSSLKN